MSYIAVEKMLSFVVAGQDQFCRWVADQRKRHLDAAETTAIADKIDANATILLESFTQAKTDSDAKTLATQLQYDGSDELREVLDGLPRDVGQSVADLESVASHYYQALLHVLRQAERDSEAAPSRELFNRLANETEAVAINDAWASRDLP